jgi:hypothetical protein
LTDGPASTSGFTNERVKMAFSLAAAARAKSNRAQTSPVHSEVESTGTLGTERRKCDDRSFRVVGLHENPAHPSAGPIRLKKARKRRVITSKTR